MTHSSTGSAPEAKAKAHAPAYRVEAPRASDAIGLALRGAFGDESGMPDEMAALLRQLNRSEQYSSH